MKIIKIWAGVVLLFLCSQTFAAEKPMISLYYYHNMQPYVFEDNLSDSLYGGYMAALAQQLPDYQFELVYLPRKRLDWMLDNQRLNGLVIGVNPIWMGDRDRTKYVWTSPLAIDRDIVVFTDDADCTYSGPASLFGKKVTFVDGYYLFGITEAIAEGKIAFTGTSTQLAVSRMVNSARANAGVMSEASLNYYRREGQLDSDFCVAETPQDEFTRHVMMTRLLDEKIHIALLEAHTRIVASAEWAALISALEMSPLPSNGE